MTIPTCNSGVCGTGTGNFPQPGDPDNNSLLSASPAFGGVDVTWTYPGLNPYAVAHVVLYRGTSAVFEYAVRHAVVNGTHYYDKTLSESLIEYYYWIQIVSVNGTYGDVIGPARAVARPTIAQVLEGLAGKIDAGSLAQTLKQQLDQVQLNALGLSEEVLARAAADDALGAAFNEVSAFTTQTRALLQEEVLARASAGDAFVAAVNTLYAQIGENSAAIQQVREASVSDTEALAQTLSQVEVKLNGNVATGEVGLVAEVETIGDRVQDIGALYTAKVGVNGLIGGFGVYNDGREVEAGFDVDRFWIGRTGGDQKKPFVVADGEVFINGAVIDRLIFNKLRADDGSLLVENGKLKADYIQADQLVVGYGNVQGLGSLATLNGLNFADLLGPKPPENATRNVYRGSWFNATTYAIGDQVVDRDYGWACVQGHTSDALSRPPEYPETANAFWVLSSVKGTPARLVYLSASSQVFRVATTGVATPATIELKATGQAVSGLPTFTVIDGVANLTGSGASRTLAYAGMTTDSVTVKVTWGDQEDLVTVVKVHEAADAVTYSLLCSTKVLSRNAAGAYSTGQVTFSSQAQSGTAAPMPYSGRFVISVSQDGSTFTPDYTSSLDEASLQYSLPPGIKAVRAELYAAGGLEHRLDSETVQVLEDGVTYDVKIESTNGDQFRVGQSTSTLLKARVFRNGLDITDEIPDSKFGWMRVSYFPQPAPNDDATWNQLYSSGYKQIQIDVDSVYARATFHCYITD